MNDAQHKKSKNPLKKFKTPLQQRTSVKTRLIGIGQRAADRAQTNQIGKHGK